MVPGRLIRVRKYRSDPTATLYVVAVAEQKRAIELLQKELSRPADEYEDLGRVNHTLVAALHLAAGEFARI